MYGVNTTSFFLDFIIHLLCANVFFQGLIRSGQDTPKQMHNQPQCCTMVCIKHPIVQVRFHFINFSLGQKKFGEFLLSFSWNTHWLAIVHLESMYFDLYIFLYHYNPFFPFVSFNLYSKTKMNISKICHLTFKFK